MKGLLSGFRWLIDFIKGFWNYCNLVFKMIAQAFLYIGQIVSMIITYITTIPTWIRGIVYLTMLISVLYIVIGRVGGKSGN